MATHVRKSQLKKKPLTPPPGVVEYLEHWRNNAANAEARFKQLTRGSRDPELAAYLQNSLTYWTNVVSGLQWVIGWTKRLQKKAKK